MGDSIDKKQNKVREILEEVSDLSSKFSAVGRNIVFAVIAGCWVIYDKFNSSPKICLQLSVLFAFLYLLIDMWYYGSTMLNYYDFLSFDDEKTSVHVKDEEKTFRVQHKLHNRYFMLTYVKIALLFISIASLIVYVFYESIIRIIDLFIHT